MTVTYEMRMELYKWTARLSRWKPNLIAHRWDITGEFCCGVVWHRVGDDQLQAVELHVLPDLEVVAFVHAPEPLPRIISDMIGGIA